MLWWDYSAGNKDGFMSEAYEYGEDEFDEEDEALSEEDRIRMEILEAENNEVWQEEPGDEEDEAKLAMNPLFGLFSAGGMGIPGMPGSRPVNNETESSDEEDQD